ELVERVDAQVDPRRRGGREVGVRLVQPREHGHVDSGGAHLEGFADVGDAEPLRPALDRRPRDLHGAVPVRIRLDDGEHRRGPHPRGDLADVVADGGEIDDRLPEAHTRSAITWATATPASWDIETCS